MQDAIMRIEDDGAAFVCRAGRRPCALVAATHQHDEERTGRAAPPGPRHEVPRRVLARLAQPWCAGARGRRPEPPPRYRLGDGDVGGWWRRERSVPGELILERVFVGAGQ